MVSTRSFPAVVGTADTMLKTAGVTLIGYEQIGSGYCTAIVRGGYADVRLAVSAGAEMAEDIGQLVARAVIPRPSENLEVVLPISSRFQQLVRQDGYSRLSNQAVGLLETRGFPALVGSANAMLKAAEVQLAAYIKTGDALCTAIVRGKVANVVLALDVGMAEAEKIGELHGVMVIPRPLDELEQTLPTASCWIEEPLELPVQVRREEAQLVEFPDIQELEQVPLEREITEE
nr:BMC domain-containing protein [Synechococcus sp. PCC 7336]